MLGFPTHGQGQNDSYGFEEKKHSENHKGVGVYPSSIPSPRFPLSCSYFWVLWHPRVFLDESAPFLMEMN
jgi:hypothetical protein